MIPNIFVSSTIKDLHYLREAIRETVLDLAYNPIMSDFGEVGYLNPITAAASCYQSVEQCQLFILMIGRRYGTISDDGMSVTHREFKTAQEHGIPLITFVEPQIFTYKEVFDSAPENPMWNAFPHMDHPRRTFLLLEEVTRSSSYNAVLPFNDVADAKRKLKLQIADFVGTNLQNITQPFRADFRELLAEVKTLRNQLSQSQSSAEPRKETQRYLYTMRFMLAERNSDYRNFLHSFTHDVKATFPVVMKASNFEEVLHDFGYEIEMHPDTELQEYIKAKGREIEARYASYSMFGGYVTTRNKKILITPSQLEKFNTTQKSLHHILNTHGLI